MATRLGEIRAPERVAWKGRGGCLSFTSVTLTGTVELEPSIPVVGGSVRVLLSSEMSDGTVIVYPHAVGVTTDVNGAFSISVEANDDATTTPTGTFYTITLFDSDGVQLDQFKVVVPHANPTVDVFSLPRLS